MIRKLASIREVADKKAILGADNIEMVVVDGWECIVLKSENINIGDKVVYIEIDSIVPKTDVFEFMRKSKFRVKTIKLRGQISQGLVQPISILKKPANNYAVGEDVTEELNIIKFDPQAANENKMRKAYERKPKSRILKWMLRYEWFKEVWRKHCTSAIEFPGWILKTDEERVQNLHKSYERWRNEQIKFIVTEKLDGCSFTAYINDKDCGICSRNLKLIKETSDNTHYFQVSRNYDLSCVLKDIQDELKVKSVVLQGEIIGPNIQSNKYDLSKYYFYAFNLIVDHKHLSYLEAKNILVKHHILMVPVLELNFTLPKSITDVVEYSKGNSTLIRRKREGIVIRSLQHEISFKVINPEFLLDSKE